MIKKGSDKQISQIAGSPRLEVIFFLNMLCGTVHFLWNLISIIVEK